MNLAKIQVSGVRAVAVDAVREIPAGIVGATVELEYTGGIWAGLNKTVIFRGNTTKEVLTDETTVTVPAEVVAEPRGRLRVGVYGTDAANNLIMPTLWAELGVIADAAEPSEPADSALPIWAQLYAMIGNLGNLDTAAKSSLVAAVNELVGKSGSADPEAIKKIVDGYLAANPPRETDPTVPDWAKQPEKPGYTAEEVGALSQNDLQTGIDQALAQAKESGLFDGAPGKDGNDYVLTEADKTEIAELAAELVEVPESSGGIPIPETAAVGQTIKVSAVDATGKPTAWEAVDFPSGAELPFRNLTAELVVDLTISPDESGAYPSELVVTEDMNGNPLSLEAFSVETDIKSNVSYTLMAVNDDDWRYALRVPHGEKHKSSVFFPMQDAGFVWLSGERTEVGHKGKILSTNNVHQKDTAFTPPITKLTIPKGQTMQSGATFKVWKLFVKE